MRFVIVQQFKSNKADLYQEFAFDDVNDAKNRAKTLLESSVDVKTVSVFQLTAEAFKVESVAWS